MKKELVRIGYDQVISLLDQIDKPGNLVYGVPKGGLCAAAYLQIAKVVPYPSNANVILDDIIHSGATELRYKQQYPDIPFFALIDRRENLLYDNSQWIVFPWEEDGGIETIQENVKRLIEYTGDDPNRIGLKETPDRVERSYAELYAGYNTDIGSLFKLFEGEKYDEIVLLKDIEIYSMCEHHMLPFYGKAHVAYIANGPVVGVSKLARIVDAFSRRLQIQERICEQVTEAIEDHMETLGSACIIEAVHQCMTCRGVNKQNSKLVTSSLTGNFKPNNKNNSARQELLSLINL